MHTQTPWERVVTTTPASTEPVSLGRVKRALGLDNVRDHDTTLQEVIKSATNAVSSDLGRALCTTVYTLYLERWPGRQIQLPYPPLISVGSVKYYGDTTETLDTFSSGSYTVSTGGDPGVIWLNEDKDWPDLMDRPNPIQIEFSAGYGGDTDDVPPSIQQAVCYTACYFFDQPLPVITGTIATELPLGVSRLIESERFQRY